MSHLHSLVQKYVHSNLPPRTCTHYMLCRLCASTSGAIRLAFDLLPLAPSPPDSDSYGVLTSNKNDLWQTQVNAVHG